ncbi:MAG: hypothetical protein U0270_01920 [Labilithrix sp.]
MKLASMIAGTAIVLVTNSAFGRGGTNPNPQGTGAAYTLSTWSGAPTAERNLVASGMTQPGFVFMTHVWNYPVTALSAPVPVGTGDARLDRGLYFTRPLAILFNPAQNGFKVRADDGTALPADLAYNVHYEPIASSIAFIHKATGTNIQGHVTVLDHPLTNGKPNAMPQVMAYSSPVINPHHIGVFYFNDRWAIFNEDFAAMPANAQWNILVSATGVASLTAKTTNVSSNSMYLDELPPNVRNNPKARLLVTQAWKGTYNNHPVGVWFDRSRSMWAVYNEDMAAMPVGAAFHVDWDVQAVLTGT